MDKLTTVSHDYKLALWTNRIKECRASGLTVNRWCEQNNIGIKNYYYWMRKIKREAFDTFSTEQKENIQSAIGSTLPVFLKINLSTNSRNVSTAAVTIQLNSMTIVYRMVLQKQLFVTPYLPSAAYVRRYLAGRKYLSCLWVHRYAKVH